MEADNTNSEDRIEKPVLQSPPMLSEQILRTPSLYLRASGNLAFLMSLVRCGDQLSPDEEATAKETIRLLRDAADKETYGMSVLINNEHHCAIWKAVIAELERAKGLHPNYTRDPLRQSAIVVEEALEAMTVLSTRTEHLMKAALGSTRVAAGDNNKEATAADLRNELIQTAAMCFRMLEAIDIQEVV